MPEYLQVLFPHRRAVLINGVIMGETNMVLELEGGQYEVTLGPPQNFTPAQQQIDLVSTSALTPKQVEFVEIAPFEEKVESVQTEKPEAVHVRPTTEGKQAPAKKGKAQQAVQGREVKIVPGPSTHIATDKWTLKDSLGYRAYAQAIGDFILHPLTQPPLTISIQAPWGGGKTSMMRMIQQYLDPEAMKGFAAEGEERQKDINGFQEEQRESGKAAKPLTVGQALKDIQAGQKSSEDLPLPLPPVDPKKKILTVWFNAWKYESTNQVWAGLVHAIMDQVTKRLSPLDRETFWLRLNLKRLDYDKVRKDIYNRVWAGCWKILTGWIGCLGLMFLATLKIAWVANYISLPIFGGWSILSLAGVTLITYKRAEKQENNKPAAVSLGDFLQVPNYSAEIGFVHQAEADLTRFLELLREKEICMVGFVDDLDRCSPVKVAQVMEAVNLFLAGDFPESIFIMGMDTEMVAAALQAHHKEMIACLPEDAGSPIGWRFMDKFVQLPFVIPPAEDDEVKSYLTDLLSRRRPETAGHLGEMQPQTLEEVKKQAKWDKISQEISKSIQDFNDNPDILAVISQGKEYFRGNPRELKRFVNAYRFQYCLWSARKTQKLPSPSLEQLLRWTVFSMRWPEVVRWCRQSGGTDWKVVETNGKKRAVVTARLRLLEDLSGKANNLESWQELAKEVLHLNPINTPWLHDDDLLQFLYNEVDNFPKTQRLSGGAGKGLW